MANPIDLIVTQEAIKGVDALIAKVTIAREGLLSLGQQALDSSKSVSKISTPSGLNINTSLNAQINADLQKQRELVEKLHATIAKKAEQSRLAEIRLQQSREKAFDSYQKQVNKETALNIKNEGAYQRIQNSVNALTKTYQSLAIRKELGNTLTAKEEVQLTRISTRINEYQNALKKVDASMGNHQRNVGNYASGYNALGNSINQLSREAPAFANSVNTGFMAISNNIPALFDAIGGIRKQNSALAAEGKPTVSVLKQLAGALFSWQTLLSVGVTLLTLYGGKIIDYAFGLNEAQKAQKALNEEMSKAKNTVTAEITQLQSLTAIVNDHNESSTNRKLAYDEIKKTLPGLTSATYDQAVSTGELTRVTDLYISSLIQKNIVEAEAKSIAESQTKINDLNSKSYDERIGVVGRFFQSIRDEKTQKNLTPYIKKGLKEETDVMQSELDKRKKLLVKAQEDFLKTQAILKPYITKPEKEKKERATKRPDLVAQEFGNSKDMDTALEKLKQLKKALEQTRDETSKNSTEFQQFETTIKAVNESIDFLTKGIDPIKLDIKKPFVEGTTAVINLKKETDSFMRSFVDEFASKSGFQSLLGLFDGENSLFTRMTKGMAFTKESWKADTVEMMEGAQEMYNFIANASQGNFDKEKERIEAQKEIAISYAGGSAVAIDKINKDAEKSKKDIANRENKAKQKQAMFNIAIDTAQAIMAAAPKLPLMIAMGVAGAVQIAMVASQKIPQYFDGGVHEQGGLAMINDAKGNNYVETVVTPDGKARQFSGRDVVTNLPKGTEIFTPEQWHEKQILAMMQSNGINMTANYNKSNGMTASQMDAVLGKHFSNIKTHNTTFDKNGFKSYIQNGNSRTIMNQNRVSGSGISV